jgi:hypothetical protein
MWAVLTQEGELISERECLWPALPVDVRITELRYRDRHGTVGKIHEFDSYGFQRSSITPLGGGPSIAHASTQLIGVLGDEVTIIEIDEVSGEKSQRTCSRAELTYRPELLRDGVRG